MCINDKYIKTNIPTKKLGLFNVRVRLLKIKLWFTHKWFNIRYPVNYTYNLTWIKQYNVYLKKVHKIQNDIQNAL